jgi:hypothetical protein
MYKDLICLLQFDRLLDQDCELKTKSERTCLGDSLVLIVNYRTDGVHWYPLAHRHIMVVGDDGVFVAIIGYRMNDAHMLQLTVLLVACVSIESFLFVLLNE